ncbi:heme ABC exporter ATP-binding protein CcmA [Pseudooceanicola algae]|uniref:Cytochrome c biogenesis ATP-binding export protein CcmA n=1 Tax=Pseudooceanicola algae TaxID=1537215 RepID=A0A418SC32_9RHOB|nr:heme ABC exporter ATP-binding protein CcmA [Pseudooceanicola algae]QPM89969.1 Cytochrome c biogenesis ATP-binding export protein CcmA [Pseudooceanicola algae]
MSLLVENLSVGRGGLVLLEGLDFSVSAGEALVLRGPNGSGKTTLLRVLARLQPALAGRLSVESDHLAYAGHADGIKAQLSVAENLAFWAEVHGQRGIDRALEDFGLSDLAPRRAGTLSAGQKRRLGLARLVVTGRAIWLLDEPTVSLDSASVALFAAAVQRHLTGGGLAIIATHIDLGLPKARVLDVSPYKARLPEPGDLDEAFL